MNPRLFLSIRPPAAVRAQLLALMRDVEGARWQSDAQLHLTLAYLGEVAAGDVPGLTDALSSVPFGPFSVTLCGLSGFTRKGRAKTIHALADGGPALGALHEAVIRACASAGVFVEPRPYRPHVTLARLTAAAGPLDAFAGAQDNGPLGSWRCDSYALVQSHLDPGGSRYEPLRIFAATE